MLLAEIHPTSMPPVISAEVLRFVDSSVLCWLATVDPDGVPNVSPKEVFCAHGGSELLIANIASPESVRNLQKNPNACVSFVDVFVQKGFKLKGAGTVVLRGHPRFSEFERPLLELTKGAFPILSIICIQVVSAFPILAPSYRTVPGTTEESQAISAQKLYKWPRN